MQKSNEHLLRRAGFGVNRSDRKSFADYSYEELVELLISELTCPPTPLADDFDPFVEGSCQNEWLRRMLSGRARLAEKLTLFWHGHFATSNFKVANMELMWQQHKLFRELGSGPFLPLLVAVSKDPAMLLWLDNNSNRKSSPNENYARELMELFCLGEGQYTEKDIKEIARALTGWSVKRGRFIYQKKHHDFESKVIFGKRGSWSGEQALEIVASQPRCGLHLAERLALFFVGGEAPLKLCEQMARESTVAAQLRQLFLSGWFKRFEARTKSPVEFLLGALRELEFDSVPEWSAEALEGMGQSLFYPPSVKGWDGSLQFLSAAFLVERFQVAERLAKDTKQLRLLAGPAYQIL